MFRGGRRERKGAGGVNEILLEISFFFHINDEREVREDEGGDGGRGEKGSKMLGQQQH